MKAAKIVIDPKKDGIPVELQTQNRKPLTPEQKAKIEADIAVARAKGFAKIRDKFTAEQIETLKNAPGFGGGFGGRGGGGGGGQGGQGGGNRRPGGGTAQ
jgi:hypothetical protein